MKWRWIKEKHDWETNKQKNYPENKGNWEATAETMLYWIKYHKNNCNDMLQKWQFNIIPDFINENQEILRCLASMSNHLYIKLFFHDIK